MREGGNRVPKRLLPGAAFTFRDSPRSDPDPDAAPRPSTTPDSWAVAERHRANICSDVAWVVYESHESHDMLIRIFRISPWLE